MEVFRVGNEVGWMFGMLINFILLLIFIILIRSGFWKKHIVLLIMNCDLENT